MPITTTEIADDCFVCTSCKNIFDIDDSAKIMGELYCISCAKNEFDYKDETEQSIPCAICLIPVAIPAGWSGNASEVLCNVHATEDEDKCRDCGDPNTNGEGYDGLCGSCADKQERPHIRVEYDTRYFGGGYTGVGDFVYIPLETISKTHSVEEAFTAQTGLPRVHIIHFCPDELWTAAGEVCEGD